MLAGFFSIFIFTIAWLPNDDQSDIKEKTLNLGKIFLKRNILFLFILLAV